MLLLLLLLLLWRNLLGWDITHNNTFNAWSNNDDGSGKKKTGPPTSAKRVSHNAHLCLVYSTSLGHLATPAETFWGTAVCGFAVGGSSMIDPPHQSYSCPRHDPEHTPEGPSHSTTRCTHLRRIKAPEACFWTWHGHACSGEHDFVLRGKRNIRVRSVGSLAYTYRCFPTDSGEGPNREGGFGSQANQSLFCAGTATSCRTHGFRRSSWCVRRLEWEPI